MGVATNSVPTATAVSMWLAAMSGGDSEMAGEKVRASFVDMLERVSLGVSIEWQPAESDEDSTNRSQGGRTPPERLDRSRRSS